MPFSNVKMFKYKKNITTNVINRKIIEKYKINKKRNRQDVPHLLERELLDLKATDWRYPYRTDTTTIPDRERSIETCDWKNR